MTEAEIAAAEAAKSNTAAANNTSTDIATGGNVYN